MAVVNSLTLQRALGDSPAALRPDLQVVVEWVAPKEKVLDLGCGDGALLRSLIDTHRVTGRGIELSEEGVLACVHQGISVRQGDLHEGLGDYPNQSFDTVILSYTLPYLNDPARIIGEMLRVGQRAIVSFPNWGHWRCRLNFLLSGRTPRTPGLPQPWDSAPRLRPLTVSDFEAFCASHRFRVSRQAFLSQDHRLGGSRWRNLLSTAAVFELRQ